MRSVDAQFAMVTKAAVAPEPVRTAIAEALGLMCAEEVTATRPLPGFVQAAIDGYAVRAVDVGGQKPLTGRLHGVNEYTTGTAADAEEEPGTVTSNAPGQISLPVVGQVAAGSRQPLRLQPKQAVRVETGAPLPTLADAVLPLEWSDRGVKRVTALRPVRSGDFIRKVGDDIQPGDVAVSPGSVLGPAQIALLAAVGRSKVLVYPRPRVAVISVGAELVDIDREPGLGQVFDVNSHLLAAAAKEAGADVHRVGIAAGEPRRLKEIVEGQIMRSEIIVIAGAVGGASSQEIRTVLDGLGTIDTTRVAMHPGSVQGFGLIGEEQIPVFLLPSNPVSAMVIFEVFIRPMVRMCLGKRSAVRRVVRARSLNRIVSRPGRRGYVRARLMRDADTRDYLVEGLGSAADAGAHLLAGMGEANAMVRIQEDVTDIRPGEVVDVMFLNQT